MEIAGSIEQLREGQIAWPWGSEAVHHHWQGWVRDSEIVSPKDSLTRAKRVPCHDYLAHPALLRCD